MIARDGDGKFRVPPWRHRGLMMWCAVLLFGVAPPMFILRVADARWIGWLLIALALALSAWNFFGTMIIAASPSTVSVSWRIFGITRKQRYATTSVRALERRLDRTRIFQGLAIDGREIAIECSDDEIVTLAREINDALVGPR